ncbi:hypothetical protein EVAR_8115_1 [Eumeta japonica]|uniref:Uncharacterized protein n=1 Tax=Eumeta variegata TaxID=151549 RepID=A0A4C1TSQ8_EUMVA|nr:hypothetical protein EVAR_8115_1 [Eumeta japonica]
MLWSIWLPYEKWAGSTGRSIISHHLPFINPTPLGLQVSMSGDENLLCGGLQARAKPERNGMDVAKLTNTWADLEIIVITNIQALYIYSKVGTIVDLINESNGYDKT